MIIRKSSLKGTVQLDGAKNSALRLLAASILTKDPICLENYPSSILDAQIHVKMLERLGKSCDVAASEVIITENQSLKNELFWDDRSIRNTLLILGALTTRYGYGAVPLPGGCSLGDRKFDLHVMLLEKFGANVSESNNMLIAEAPQGLIGTEIHLPIRSTGATENAILCATLAKGTTRIWNPHIRPEILDLTAMLNKMGAKISVRGQESIVVEGVVALSGATHRVIPDNIEAITWLIGAAITGGDVEILDFPFEHLEIPLVHLRESGVEVFRYENKAIVRGKKVYPTDISTGPYPGINSDMQPLFAVLGMVADGESRIVDLRFPGRYDYSDELAKMGMEREVKDNLLRIRGGRALSGATVKALDLRAGAALMLAGMVADGETIIEDSWQIRRGYSNLESKLMSLGADITI